MPKIEKRMALKQRICYVGEDTFTFYIGRFTFCGFVMGWKKGIGYTVWRRCTD